MKVTFGTVSKLHDTNANRNTDDTLNDCGETCPIMTRKRQSKILVSPIFLPGHPFPRQRVARSPSANNIDQEFRF